MPQDVGDIEPTSNPGLKGCTVPAPDGNFPALSIPQTPQDPQSLLLPAAPGRLLRPPAQDKARPARPESQPPPLIPFLSGCGGWTQTGSEEGIGGMGITWGPSPAAGTSAGRAQPGRRRREAGRRVNSRRLRRGPRPADADKAPGSRAPPPPASRPATQRHAHGPRPLRLSLVAPEATRLRPPPAATPPLPGALGRGTGAPTWLRGRTRDAPHQRVVTPVAAACFPLLPQRSIVGREGTGTTFRKSETALCGAARGWRV